MKKTKRLQSTQKRRLSDLSPATRTLWCVCVYVCVCVVRGVCECVLNFLYVFVFALLFVCLDFYHESYEKDFFHANR